LLNQSGFRVKITDVFCFNRQLVSVPFLPLNFQTIPQQFFTTFLLNGSPSGNSDMNLQHKKSENNDGGHC